MGKNVQIVKDARMDSRRLKKTEHVAGYVYQNQVRLFQLCIGRLFYSSKTTKPDTRLFLQSASQKSQNAITNVAAAQMIFTKRKWMDNVVQIVGNTSKASVMVTLPIQSLS